MKAPSHHGKVLSLFVPLSKLWPRLLSEWPRLLSVSLVCCPNGLNGTMGHGTRDVFCTTCVPLILRLRHSATHPQAQALCRSSSGSGTLPLILRSGTLPLILRRWRFGIGGVCGGAPCRCALSSLRLSIVR